MTGAVIALMLSLTALARASEGYISLYYNVEGVGESSYTLSHSAGASEGLGDEDTVWYFIACVTCRTDTKAVSSVGGVDVKNDRRPLSSESGVTVRCGVVAKNGDSITIDNAAQWVDIYMYGFEGYDVYVNGHNARETSRIDLGPVTGTYSSGSTLETLSISFSRQPGYDPGDPPVTPDPDTDPDPDPDPVPDPAPDEEERPTPGEPAPDALFITNAIEGCPQNRTAVWTLTHTAKALDTIDDLDVLHEKPSGEGFHSLIVSSVSESTTGERFLLAVDARPPACKDDIDLCIGVESASDKLIHFTSPAENELIFDFPAGTKDCFAGKPLTFQQYDPTNPGLAYPVWDVRQIIGQNQGILRLADLTEYRSSGIPYLYARVSTNRLLGDVRRDGRIDLSDYDLIASQEGFVGATDADIAGAKGLGLPDGEVDAWDLYHLYEMLSDADKGKVIPPTLPVVIEGFETGALDSTSWYCVQWPHWFVTSEDRHSGTYSARAGRIGDGEITSLRLTADCTAGRIGFWRKVSSEPNWDVYRFYIDNALRETLSGDVAWSEVSFAVAAGIHTFRWEYEKDGSTSQGSDTVYLDDVRIPVRE